MPTRAEAAEEAKGDDCKVEEEASFGFEPKSLHGWGSSFKSMVLKLMFFHFIFKILRLTGNYSIQQGGPW